jgi:predicted RNase H-like nuclease (RuvC/YqgF family)
MKRETEELKSTISRLEVKIEHISDCVTSMALSVEKIVDAHKEIQAIQNEIRLLATTSDQHGKDLNTLFTSFSALEESITSIYKCVIIKTIVGTSAALGLGYLLMRYFSS